MGVLLTRTDETRSISEGFLYDNLNRLTEYGGNVAQYDAKGNILDRSDVGHFSYTTQNKPYAISKDAPYENAIPLREQHIGYTSFMRPDTILENDYLARFTYNEGGNRVRMRITQNGFLSLDRYYLGGGYEVDEKTSGTTERLYLGGDAYSAPAVYLKDGTGSWNLYYICRDYLGSIIAITNSSGSLVQELSYDAWGRLRDPDTQEVYSPGNEPTLLLGRGYTGHEHLIVFGLINMNARLYDPALGRFLSPDPYVQSPDFSQNFNRYSYGLNNPLKFTDPSGESFLLGAAFIGGFINVAVQGLSGKINNIGDFWLAFGIGALSGLGGALAGQFCSSAITLGGFFGGAAIGASSGAIGGIINGAGNAWAIGSSFIDGLKAGLIGGGTGFLAGGILGGLARGITDAKNGYNFWDGSRVDQYIEISDPMAIADYYNSNSNGNDALLHDRMLDEFGVKEGDYNIKKITTTAGKGYGMTSDGKYVVLNGKSDGIIVGGYAKNFSSGYTEVHISPYYTCSDQISFRAIAGHELIHAYHYYSIPNVSTIYTERVAYQYTYNVFENNGRFSSALSTIRTAYFNNKGIFWGAYPPKYSVLNFFNLF